MGKTGRALNDGIKSFVDNNVTEAIRLLTPLAAVGYEAAQLNLAYIYKVPACLQSHAAVFRDRQSHFFPGKARSKRSCDSSSAFGCWSRQPQSSRYSGQFRLLGHWNEGQCHAFTATLCCGCEVGQCAWRFQLRHDVGHGSHFSIAINYVF